MLLIPGVGELAAAAQDFAVGWQVIRLPGSLCAPGGFAQGGYQIGAGNARLAPLGAQALVPRHDALPGIATVARISLPPLAHQAGALLCQLAVGALDGITTLVDLGLVGRGEPQRLHQRLHGVGIAPGVYPLATARGDALVGDASLFARRDEVELAWEIIDPIIDFIFKIEEIKDYCYVNRKSFS